MDTFSKSEVEFLKTYAKDYGAYICAQKIGRSFESVLSKIKRENIPYSYKKTNKSEYEISMLMFNKEEKYIDYNFETTSSPECLAYFIGFFWADGTINRGTNVIIEIAKEDGENIKDIFSKVCDFKVSYRKRDGRKEQMFFFFKDKDFSDFITSMGKYSHSSESHEKILSYIPKEYQIYFLRGLIDGDGCFYIGHDKRNNGRSYVQFSISSNYEQDWSTIGVFFKNHNINYSISKRDYKEKKSKYSHFRITGKDNLEKLIHLLYENNDNILLERKKNLAFRIIDTISREKEETTSRIPIYKVLKDGAHIDTIKTTIREYCNKNGLCYGNFARLTNHPDRSWKGYSLIKI